MKILKITINNANHQILIIITIIIIKIVVIIIKVIINKINK